MTLWSAKGLPFPPDQTVINKASHSIAKNKKSMLYTLDWPRIGPLDPSRWLARRSLYEAVWCDYDFLDNGDMGERNFLTLSPLAY
jgi:hypothetical protein